MNEFNWKERKFVDKTLFVTQNEALLCCGSFSSEGKVGGLLMIKHCGFQSGVQGSTGVRQWVVGRPRHMVEKDISHFIAFFGKWNNKTRK